MVNTYTKSALVFMLLLVVSSIGFTDAYGYGGGKKKSKVPKTPKVLGATTGPACTAYLTTFMGKGRQNNVEEVKKLQQFLNEHMDAKLTVNGTFDDATEQAVKAFQLKYRDDVLTPWGLLTPTGFVFRTTQRQINLLKCPTLKLPLPGTLVF